MQSRFVGSGTAAIARAAFGSGVRLKRVDIGILEVGGSIIGKSFETATPLEFSERLHTFYTFSG